MKNQNAPFMIGVHYMSNCINLVVQTFSKFNIVGKIEDVSQSLYACFSHSPIFFQEFIELVDIMETWG